jgi:hypothetical protein
MTGAELRDAGLERAGSGGPVVPLILWQFHAEQAILSLCLADGNFGPDDVRRIAGNPPHPNVMGAIFRSMARRGLIVPAGVGVARRPERHASICRLWRRA